MTDISKDNWGPSLWKFLHITAPVIDDVEAFRELLLLLSRCLPCKVCRQHVTEHLVSFPPLDFIKNNKQASAYTYLLHNKVNVTSFPAKDPFLLEEYIEKYGDVDFTNFPTELLKYSKVRDVLPVNAGFAMETMNFRRRPLLSLRRGR